MLLSFSVHVWSGYSWLCISCVVCWNYGVAGKGINSRFIPESDTNNNGGGRVVIENLCTSTVNVDVAMWDYQPSNDSIRSCCCSDACNGPSAYVFTIAFEGNTVLRLANDQCRQNVYPKDAFELSPVSLAYPQGQQMEWRKALANVSMTQDEDETKLFQQT